MDTRLIALQQAPDYFALLGLPPKFALTDQQIRSAIDAVGATLESSSSASDAATQQIVGEIRQRLSAANQTLSDPLARGEYLLNVFDAPKEPTAVAPDVSKIVGQMQGELSIAVAARDDARLGQIREQLEQERKRHLDRVAELLSFPRNMPNAVAQRTRDAIARLEINAVRMVDQVLKQV